MDFIKHIDQSLFFFLNGMYSAYWDKAMFLFSSREIWIPFYVLIIYVIIKNFRKNSVYILILIGLSIAVSDQFSGLVKDTVARLRPSNDPGINSMVHLVNGYKGGLYGFFSSHASNSFTIAVIASMLFKNRLFSVVMFIWAIVISYTRIYLGLHYPGDILVGWIWGAIIGFGFYKLMIFVQQRYFKSTTPDLRFQSISRQDVFILTIFVIIYALTILVTINRLTKYQFFG